MASIGLSICSTSKPLIPPSTSAAIAASSSTSSCRGSTGTMYGCRCSRIVALSAGGLVNRSRRCTHVVCMAPDEERLTRRSPLEFPVEWERAKPARRPDIFPQFSPMRTPIPPPLPFDPPEEDEEEEEVKEEEEENPDKEEEIENPDNNE